MSIRGEHAIREIFRNLSLTPTRENVTVDGGILFEFLNKKRFCVDLYPTGEVILILRTGKDHVWDLDLESLDVLENILIMNLPDKKPERGMTLTDWIGEPQISFSDFIKLTEKEREDLLKLEDENISGDK